MSVRAFSLIRSGIVISPLDRRCCNRGGFFLLDYDYHHRNAEEEKLLDCKG